MVETFTPRIGATTSDSKVGETSQDGRGRSPIVWGQGIQIRQSTNLPNPSNSVSRPAARLSISQSSVSDAISRLQQEKARIQKDYDRRKADHDELQLQYDQRRKTIRTFVAFVASVRRALVSTKSVCMSKTKTCRRRLIIKSRYSRRSERIELIRETRT